MLITRKKNPPLIWAFFAQITLILSIYASTVVNAPFLFLIKRFIDNPAAIMGLISIEVYVTLLGGPLVAWLSDRIWTRFGRRKMFVAGADFARALFLFLMPFAPNLWILISLKWLMGLFSDLGSPGQSLIYEVVPARQRGRSAGFLKAFMNLGNIVFFTMLLGRINDTYFMGPFSFLTGVSGMSMLFWVGALLVFGAALFEWFGIKEIYPPGRKRLHEGRKPGEKTFFFFLRSIYKDVFAKDLLPLYLLLFANMMFAFSLGVFQPLLFVEQWGYDLQFFGNTVAIGVPLGIALGLLAGWLADRFGKMTLMFWATVGNLIVNIIYTVYVATLPDFRPSFWEIVIFGNIALIFGSIKGVAAGPLLWEYVARNRMGAATAGIVLFNTLFRNSIALFVGLWLMWWSIWFFPQAGFSVTAAFNADLPQDRVLQSIEAAGIDTTDLVVEPRHQYGVDGETSQRWWIHQESRAVQKLIKEREELQNQISSLEGKKVWFLTREEKIPEIEAEIKAKQQRRKEIAEDLEARAEALEEEIAPAMANDRFQPGDQLWNAEFEEGRFLLEVRTIESILGSGEGGGFLTPLVREISGWFGELETVEERNLRALNQNLRSGETVLAREDPDDPRSRLVPDYVIEAITSPDGHMHGVRWAVSIDPRFFTLFDALYQSGLEPPQAYNLTSALMASFRARFGRETDDFSIPQASASTDGEQTPTQDEDKPPHWVEFTLLPSSDSQDDAIPVEELELELQAADQNIQMVTGSLTGAGRYQLKLGLKPREITDAEQSYREILPKLKEMLGDNGSRQAFAMVMFRRLAETLASVPVYVTVPKHEPDVAFSERTYEYFFSSQTLQIGTDIFGIGILIFILILEKRGSLIRHGALEDEKR